MTTIVITNNITTSEFHINDDIIDPGPYVLLYITILLCMFITLIVVPVTVYLFHNNNKQQQNHHQQQQQQQQQQENKNCNEGIISNSVTGEDDEEEESGNDDDDDVKTTTDITTDDNDNDDNDDDSSELLFSFTKDVLCCCNDNDNNETKQILQLGIPYILSHISTELFTNMCFIVIAQYAGSSNNNNDNDVSTQSSSSSSKMVVAYALVHLIMDLIDGVLHGPLDACCTVCSHAIGANNPLLAGQYVQIAIILYILLYIPILLFLCTYMDILLQDWLHWTDDDDDNGTTVSTAILAKQYIQIIFPSYIISAIHSTIWQSLLDISNHATQGAIIDGIQGICTVLIVYVTAVITKTEFSLYHVGVIYNITEFVFLLISIAWAEYHEWLQPFHQGLLSFVSTQSPTTRNHQHTKIIAIKKLIQTAIPLSWSYLSLSTEWTVLTILASSLGPAEVAAWAILGNIWDLFFYSSIGFGEATEIRTSYHLGQNNPYMAKHSTYKSLSIGIVLATTISLLFFFTLQDVLPSWYTKDETLQGILRELLPFVGISNLAMNFGMGCWSVVGAMGQFDLATRVSLCSTWGLSIPLSAILILIFRINLQGLMAASTLGYVITGACLSYVVLTSDWKMVAKTISEDNCDDDDDDDNHSDYFKDKSNIEQQHSQIVNGNVDERTSLLQK